MSNEGEAPKAKPDPASPPASESASRRAWQGQASASDDTTRGSRQRLRIVLFTGLLSLLAALVIVLILYIAPSPTAPHFLAINVAEHNYKHFPLQAFARADSELLMRHFQDENKKEATTRTKELLRAELDGLKNQSADALVIHLTAPALVRDGTVYLLPADAEPDNPATWLDVKEVLQAVEKCRAKNKLLILDLAHGLVDPRLGVTADRVAETLEAQLKKEEPPFFVLCPCSAGQSSLTSEVMRSSVLAYYLDQGLLGAADTEEEGDRNGSVSVKELVAYVKPRVDRWARNNRGVRQQPLLFGKGKNFTVAPLGRPVLEKIDLAAPTPYPDELLNAWKKHDEAWKRGIFLKASRPLLRLEANLMRAESRWQGGAGKDLLDRETDKLLGEIGKLLATPAPAPRPLSVMTAKESPAAVITALSNIFLRGTDVKATQDKVAKMLQADKEAEYSQQARLVVDALSLLPELKQDQLKIAKEVLGGLKKRVHFVEVLYIDRLALFADREFTEEYVKAKVEVVWRTMREREDVLATLARGPEFLPWVESALEKADKNRRSAEAKLLWDERPPDWPAALEELQASRKTYDRVKKALDGMQTAGAAVDRAFAELPVQLRILCDGPVADLLAEQNWFKAADEALLLQKFFVAPVDAGDPLKSAEGAEIDTHGRALNLLLDELMHSFRLRVKDADNADTAPTQRQMRGLLQSPRLKAVDRADMFNKLRQSAKKLHDESDTKDRPAAKVAERDTGAVRARMSLALLSLAGIEAEAEKAGPADVEKKLHQLWGVNGLAKSWRKPPNDRRGQAMGRLVSPWDPQPKDEDPGRTWQAKMREDHLDWLKRQYKLESRDTGPSVRKMIDTRDEPIREFYLEAAQ